MKFRKEIYPSSIAPLVDEERTHNINEIAEGLKLSLQLGDKKGARIWNYNLYNLLRQGYPDPFSSPYISCVDSLYKWIFKSSINDFSVRSKLSTTLCYLLKKVPLDQAHLITEILDWKEMYLVLVQSHLQSPSEHCGAQIKLQHAIGIVRVIKKARTFLADTSEVVNHFLKGICPHDHTNSLKHQLLLLLFLPPLTCHEPSHLLIRERIMNVLKTAWDWIGKCDIWDYQWMAILSKFAKNSWKSNEKPFFEEDFLEKLFTKALEVLDISVASNRKLKSLRKPTEVSIPEVLALALPHKLAVEFYTKFSQLVIYSIHENNSSLNYIIKLLNLSRLYFHPSNTGNWTDRLACLLKTLSLTLEKRIAKGKILFSEENDYSSLVTLLMDISLQAIRSKSDSMKHAGIDAIRSLLWIDITHTNNVLDSIQTTLESTTSPKQAIACIQVLSNICFVLLPDNHKSEDDADLLLDRFIKFINLTILGLDSNDIYKTRQTLSFFTSFLLFVPSEKLNSNNFNQKYQDWNILMLDRLFQLLKNGTKEDLKDILYLYNDFINVLVTKWNEETSILCITKCMEYIISNRTEAGAKCFMILVKLLVRNNASSNLIGTWYSKLMNSIMENNSLKELSDTQMKWRMQILSSFVEGLEADFIVSKKEDINQIVNLCIKSSSKEAFKGGLHLSEVVFHRLSTFYLLPQQKSSLETMDTVSVSWYEPGEHVTFAYELLDKLINDCIQPGDALFSDKEFENKIFDSKLTSRQVLERILMILKSIIGHGGSLFRNSTEHPQVQESIKIKNTGYPDISFLSQTIGKSFEESNYSRREKLGNLLILFGNQISSTIFSASLVDKYSAVLGFFLSSSVTRYYANAKYHNYAKKKKKYACRLHPKALEIHAKPLYPTIVLLDRIWCNFQNQVSNQNQHLKPTELHSKLIDIQYQLSQNGYIDVRRTAQESFSVIFNYFYSFREYLTKNILDSLVNATKDSDLSSIKGNLYLLGAALLQTISDDFSSIELFVKGLLNISVSFERPSVQKLVYSCCVEFCTRSYHPSSISSNFSVEGDSTVVQEARNQYNINSKSNEQLFNQITEYLLSHDLSQHWRYQILRSSFLFTLHARRDIILHNGVLDMFLSHLTSDITTLRKIAQSVLPSLLSLHCGSKSIPLFVGWNNEYDDSVEISHASFCPITQENRNLLLQYWNNENWVNLTTEYLAEDHHIRTEEEEEGKNSMNFDLSKLPKFIQRLASKSGSLRSAALVSDLAQDLLSDFFSITTEVWPKSNDNKFLSYLFNPAYAYLFSIIFSIFNESDNSNDFVNINRNIWNNRILSFAKSDDRKQQVACAEIICGSLQGLFQTSNENSMIQQIWEDYKPILVLVFNGDIGIGLDWPSGLRFALTGTTPKQFMPIISDIVDSSLSFLDNSDGLSYKLVKTLHCIRAIHIEGSWRWKSYMNNSLKSALRNAGNSSSLIRIELAQLIALALTHLDNPEEARKILSLESLSSEERETTLLWLSQLNITGESSSNILNWGSDCISFVLQSTKDSSTHVQQLARSCLALLSQSQFPSSTIESLINYVESIYKVTDWHIRRAILPVLQLIDFNHRFCLSDENHKRIHEICIKLLADSQVEVRELASIALSSVLIGCDEEYLTKLVERFTKAARVKLNANEEKNKNRMNVKHGGVLGLCSIMRMYPYNVPSFLVPVMLEIANHNDDPTSISGTVRTAMKDFWRTHQEMWHVYKLEVFTVEQVQTLEELLISPSYYA